MYRTWYILIVFYVFSARLFVLSAQQDSAFQVLPENRLWPVMHLDPLECQVMGGSYILSGYGSASSLYSTVNLGFSKPVFAGRLESFDWEFNFGTAIFSQFDLVKREDGVFLAGLMNNDFKLSGDLAVRRGQNLLRLRTFHISSHLGDDFILRHPDTLRNDKTVNYEQADLTYMRMKGNNYLYAGAGWIYTIYAFRERLSFQAGGIMNFREEHPVSLFSGADIKILSENDFNPDIRAVYGVCFRKKAAPLIRIWLEFYSGRLPYSTIDYGKVNWFGAAMAVALK